MRVLIIDDSSAIRKALNRHLQDLGFETFEAATGTEGLQQFQKIEKLDLALVDWNLPDMSGYDVVKEVRTREEWRSIRLVMVTTECERSQMVRSLATSADEYLMKPFTRETLVEKINLTGLDLPV